VQLITNGAPLVLQMQFLRAVASDISCDQVAACHPLQKQITASERNSELEHATGTNRSIYLFNYLLFVYLFIYSVYPLYLTLLLNDEDY
jgi:hypothetical protein